MDLEMTGLEPAVHTIVEIATLVTDDDLTVIAEGPDLVIHQPPEALAAMPDVVRAMHRESGLLQAIEQSTLGLGEACEQTLAFVKAHVPEPRTVPLAGNSIGTDRRFLATFLPGDRGVAALPLCRRVDHQGARPPLVSRGTGVSTVQGRPPPGPRRHPRERRRAASLPRDDLPLRPCHPGWGTGPSSPARKRTRRVTCSAWSPRRS